MTGHGEGQSEHIGGSTILAEVRSVNNRHLKIHLRMSEGLGGYEPAVESAIRAKVRRGSIQMSVFWRNRPSLDLYQIQPAIAESYVLQCRELSQRLGMSPTLNWSDLVSLPGVVAEPYGSCQSSPELEAAIMQAAEQALKGLESMRASEGTAMETELRRLVSLLRETLRLVEQRAPQVLTEYRQRLKSRVASAIAEAMMQPEVTAQLKNSTQTSSPDQDDGIHRAWIQDADLIREVAIMADRSDVREEVVRLGSHFSQFEELLGSSESQGRRLDFLVQEMFREANTIGSKASDALISQQVVEMKAMLEQIREMVQNVE